MSKVYFSDSLFKLYKEAPAMKKLLMPALALVALVVFSGPAVAQQSWSVAIEQNPMLTNCGTTTNIPVAGANSCATAITAAQNLLTTLLATPNCMGPSCPAGSTMTQGAPSCTVDNYIRPNGSPATRYQVTLRWDCVPPRVSCAKPPPATNYNTGSTSANNVPLNLCYKNTVGECLYNFAPPGTATGWNTGCPPSVAGSDCCGWNTPPPTGCTQDITTGALTISTPTASNVTATSANLSGTVSVAPIPPGCTYTAKLVWGPAPTPPFPNTAATGSIPSSPLNLSGTASPLNPGSAYGARIEVTKACAGLAPTVCNGPTKRFETPKGGTGEICLFKFNDLDGDGVRDLNEPLLPGWTFNINPGPPNQVNTGAQGGICFGVSAPGTYTISEVPQPGWTPTTPTSQTVTVPPSPVNVFFGNSKKASPTCTITITKKTSPSGGSGFSFSSAWSGLQGITLGDGQSITKPVGCGPIFNVWESPKPGWALTNIACNFSSGTGSFSIIGATSSPTNGFESGDNEVNFSSLTPGANLQCTYTNKAERCDLQIKKTISPTPLVSGQPATITLTVTNVGTAPCLPGPISGTAVQDPKPAGLTFIAPPVPNQPGWQCSLGIPTGDASCGGPGLTLPPGYSATFTFTATVTAKPGSKITNCATVTNQNDTNLANNQSCATAYVIKPNYPAVESK